MHDIAYHAAVATLSLLTIVALIVIVLARSIYDRLVALDHLSVLLIAILALFGLDRRSSVYLDAALLLGLVIFVGTIAAASTESQGRFLSVHPLPLLFAAAASPASAPPSPADTLARAEAVVDLPVLTVPGILPWIADGLVLFGLLVVTIATIGMLRMPDLYTRLHAASKSGILGVVPILLVSWTTGDWDLIGRSAVIGAFLLFTTPVSTHAIARAAYLRGLPMLGGEPSDRS